ncbi:hypothetical protein X948_5700 [Burkholderia pseudomallei MSHR5608]|nr:hypothetical protein X948_5700 [Burkholderia pseudomallei MSHR5608]
MSECVARAVDAGPLAIPHAEDAIDLARRFGFDPLRPDHGRRREILVDAGNKANVMRGDQFARAPKLEVHPCERRSSVAGNISRRVQATAPVELPLGNQQANQRLSSVEEDAAAAARQIV